MTEKGLTREDTEGNDYIMPEDMTSVWVTVDNISVYIHRTFGGVTVDLFPMGRETDEPISSAHAFDHTGD